MFHKLSDKQVFGYIWWRLPQFKHIKRVVYNGAIRTLKTDGGSRSFKEWAFEIIQGYEHNRQKGYDSFLIVGTTRENIKENSVDVIMQDMEQDGFYRCEKYSELAKGKYRFYINETIGKLYIKYGNHIIKFRYLGADNKGAIRRIQGKTIHGAFIDEAALIPLSIIQTIEQRCASFKDDYKIFMTTNPEGGDEHEFYQLYIKGAWHKRTLVISYTLLDNPQFTQEDVNYYEMIYTRDMFLRKILGKWVRAIGAIYKKFTEEEHVSKIWKKIVSVDKYERARILSQYSRLRVGVDYGETAATVYTLIGVKNQYRGISVFKEWYHKDSDRLDLDINDKVDAFMKWCKEIYDITKKIIFAEIESATHGKSFYKIVKRRIIAQQIGWLKVSSVNKRQRDTQEKTAIEERIVTLNILLGANAIDIDEGCRYLISAIKNAIRDKNGQRLDNESVNVDSLDSLEYAILPDLRNLRKRIEYMR
jgi:PBSX family phage terminase large subunit